MCRKRKKEDHEKDRGAGGEKHRKAVLTGRIQQGLCIFLRQTNHVERFLTGAGELV